MASGPCLILELDEEARISEVLRDDCRCFSDSGPGTLFASAVTPESLRGALDFLADLERRGIAFNREIELESAPPGPARPFEFVGWKAEGVLIIAGCCDRRDLPELVSEMAHVALGDSNSSTGSSALPSAVPLAGGEEDCLDEICKLNNELTDMARTLSKRNAEYATLDAIRKRFLGVAVHDIRGPLASILCYFDLLDAADGEIDPAELKSLGVMAHEQTQFLVRMVDDLLDTASIEAGRLELRLDRLDLSQLVERRIALIERAAARKSLSIELDAPGRVEAEADSDRLSQLVDNLLTNAVKFSPLGATIKVEVAQREGLARVLVSDRGEGMSERELRGLFLPFGGPGRRGTSGEKSSGLGLYISKRIAEAHGGELKLESSVGQGTRAWFSIPQAKK